MAATPYQCGILKTLAEQRKQRGESYVAGGVALNQLLSAPRLSRDIDLFHNSREAVAETWIADRALLVKAGYQVEPLREAPSFVEARVSLGPEHVIMEWAQDSAFRFFPLLDRLGIAAPEVRLDRPVRPDGWLMKRSGGAGGAHVRYAGESRPPADAYHQRFEHGRTLSVLFLADGERALVLGANRQWTASARPDRPFLYGGAVGGVSLPPAVDRDIHRRLDALVAATGLVGLNGLDFILQGTRWLVLELNPRPTATAELYDPDYPQGLFGWHLRACRGSLPARPAAPG
jgi:predicted ATP-grasp superfamily ATP-dependent carboligase